MAGPPGAATRLRCEHLVDPVGIDVTRPRLSWVVDAAAGPPTAHRVVVASSAGALAAGTADVWDSGRVTSGAVATGFGGAPLTSRQTCHWMVKVWCGDTESPWSAPASFEAGLLDPAEWVASWITAIRPREGEEGHGAARWFRTSFDVVPGDVVRARAYVTALGLYELHVNGRRVAADALRPGWTDYDKRVQYQVYDVASLLVPGRNVVAAVVGDGWYAGNIGMGKARVWGEWPELLAQVEVDVDGEERVVVGTSRSWRTRPSPITANDLQQGEHYDARLEVADWASADHDAGDWDTAWPGGGPVGALSATPCQPVRPVLELRPVARTQPDPGTWVFDLGQNMVGWCRLRVRGPAGTAVTVRHAEVLDGDGRLYTANLRGAANTDRYVLAGTGDDEVWEPRFTFHGFRYVELTGLPGEPGADAVRGIVAHTDAPVTGRFECSNELVNRLHANVLWGQRGNFVDVPTDCPQRDERLGWMGDAQVFVATATYNMDVAAFFTKWLRDVRDAQLDIGAYPDICPRFGRANPPAAPGWGDAGVIVPWTLYRRYGDTRILADHFDSMTAWIDSLHRRNPDLRWRNERGVDWGDWVAIGADSPKDVLASMWWAYSTGLVARCAEVLGRDAESAHYRDLAAGIRRTWCDDHVRGDGTIEGETQTIYALALRFGLLDDGARAQAARHLVADIERRGNHLSTGFMGIAHLLPALSDTGSTAVAYRLLLDDTFPSWGYSIRHGATTIWERWDGWTEERGFQDPGMNSFNHYAFGAVGEWIYEVVGGVRVDFSRRPAIVVRPEPGDGVEWARTSYDSVLGTVGCEWATTGAGLTLAATVPAGAPAQVWVPAPAGAEITAPGAARLVHRSGTNGVYDVPPGTHRFEVRT